MPGTVRLKDLVLLKQNAAPTGRRFAILHVMNWAERRRFVVLLIVGAIVVAFIAIVLIATLYKAPSCSDGVQNQSEEGIDCGGPCAYLCTALEQPPTVLYTQVLESSIGRTDIIASVENKNATAAAKQVPYTLTLYGADLVLISQTRGVIDLPPGATVPVYVPNIATGNQIAASAFLAIEPTAPAWYRLATDPRVLPTVTSSKLGGSIAAPRVEATLVNPSVIALTNVRAVVLVRGASGTIIAASSTIVPYVPALGQAAVIFTWNRPFVDVPLSIEVVPSVPLPDRQAGLP